MNITDIAEKGVVLAEKRDATQAEVYSIRVKTTSTYIDDDIPKVSGSTIESGVGLKFILGKKIGFTSSTLAQESLEDVVARAKSIARVSDDDAKFVSLPDPEKASGSPSMFYDKETAVTDSSILVEKAMEVVQGAAAETVTVPNGTLRVSSVEYHIRNSLGVNIGSEGTIVFGFFTAKSQNNSNVGEGVQRCWSRKLSTIDFTHIGEVLKGQALSVLTAKTFKEKWKDSVAVLAPSEGSEMIYGLVGFAVNGENVNRRSSPWADKVGDVVASENLSIADNGRSELGLLSGIVDDEGVPTQQTALVEKGVLTSYIFDSYNAKQLDLKSTGNGIRRVARDLAGRFAAPPTCAGTTMEVKPSKKSLDDIIGEIKQGIYVEHFAWPQVDPMSGTFSNEIRNARVIENGELGHFIKHALWVGNLYESIKGDLLVANDPEVHDKRIVPTIAFPNTEIVGQ